MIIRSHPRKPSQSERISTKEVHGKQAIEDTHASLRRTGDRLPVGIIASESAVETTLNDTSHSTPRRDRHSGFEIVRTAQTHQIEAISEREKANVTPR